MRVRPELIALEERDLHGKVEPADERLAIGEERFLPVALRVDQLQAEVAAGAEEVAMRDRRGDQRRDAFLPVCLIGAVPPSEPATVRSFPSSTEMTTLRSATVGAGLRRLNVDALEDAEAIELALRLEDLACS